MQFGRKESVDCKQLRELVEPCVGATQIAQEMKIARSTVYRLMKQKV
ncbi:helix-turn-helix domain-containing protein [Rubritalea profundi]